MNPQQPDRYQVAKPSGEKKPTERYDWRALKIEFTQGPWEKASDFRKDKGIPSHSSTYSHMRGWEKAKKLAVDRVIHEDIEEAVEVKPAEIHTIRRRQAQDARLLQQKGFDALEVLEPKTAEDARKMIVSGLQEERAALGFSEKGGQPSLTQVNVNLPKTKFDKIVNDQDFAGLLKLIADVKRERARRAGGIAPTESKATVR